MGVGVCGGPLRAGNASGFGPPGLGAGAGVEDGTGTVEPVGGVGVLVGVGVPGVGVSVGRASSFRMVPVALAVPSTALVGVAKVRVSVSSGSRVVSPQTVTVAVPVVLPAGIVTVPLVLTKSMSVAQAGPPLAVPLASENVAVTGAPTANASVTGKARFVVPLLPSATWAFPTEIVGTVTNVWNAAS